jgi:chromosome segregation ATPase
VRIDIHIHIHEGADILRELHSINRKLETIMTTAAEAIATLRAVRTQQEKTSGEIRTLQGSVDTLNERIAALEQIIANGDLPQELVDAVTAVKEQAQIVDDQIPDAPPPVPEPTP